MTFTSNLTLQSHAAFKVKIGGTAQGSQYDFVNAGGQGVDLGGVRLEVALPNYMPQRSDTFAIVDAGSLIGGFGNLHLGRVAVTGMIGTFAVSTAGNRVILSDFARESGGTVLAVR
jgi:hypothetical protein